MKNLEVIVVGGGIGGLATALALAADGHKVTALEAVKEFTEVGAGIRVPPNVTRLLRQWGVDLDSIKKEISHGNRFVDWKDHKKVLLDVSFEDFPERFGAPYYLIHRADLVGALVKAASANTANISIHTSSKVVEYDYERPAVKTEQGLWYTGDLVVSAEGIKSSARTAISGENVEPRDTGDVAYRILVPAKPMLEDPETTHLVKEPWATHWIGPEAHAVGYPLRGGELYNIIIDITRNTDMGEQVREGDWMKKADNTELLQRLKDWCYPVHKLCGITGEYLKWKLADFDKPLQRWVHPTGKALLVGDSCHPMMPYMAQGAAQAIEDAACLRVVLAAYGDESIAKALAVFERQRMPRASYITRNTRILQEWWHLYDGPAREKRDEVMKRDDVTNPIFWGFSKRKDWLFGLPSDRILRDDELEIPGLAPLPAAEDSVYSALHKG